MKIFITGGAGYIAYSLIELLDQHPEVEHITVYDNLLRNNHSFFTNGKKLSKTSFVKGDILNEYELNKHLAGHNTMVHMAAYVDSPYSYKDQYVYEQVNQFGTSVVCHAAKQQEIKSFIYLSSGAVYGFQPNANELSEPMPENGYGISKREGEKYVELLKDTCKIHIVRASNVFGYNPMYRYDSVINHFILDSLIHKKFQIYGNGNQTRPFVHISYLEELLLKIITKEANFDLVNVVQGSMSMNDLRDILMEEFAGLEFSYVSANLDLKGYQMESLKYTIDENVEDSIRKTVKEFQSVFRLQTHE